MERPSATRIHNAPSGTPGNTQNATRGCGPEDLLRRDEDSRQPTAAELLNPGSALWAGAPALSLRFARPRLLLAEGVIAYTGDGAAAAAARADGTILLFTPECGPAPRLLRMPEGHPAFALALAQDGGSLVAWSQGTGEFVAFDLASGASESSGKALRTAAPLAGEAMLALSADGRVLAAHDGSGALWAGALGGELRPIGHLQGNPVLLAFSAGGGVLVAVDANGAGRVWNPRTGKNLKSFTVPGGPFVRGHMGAAPGLQAEAGQRILLWTTSGEGLEWDLLRGAVADEAQAGGEWHLRGGELHLRNQSLFYVGGTRSWTATPEYEPRLPSLSWSAQEGCLRLQDLDGAVRYYSAQGDPRSQCFAVDWSPLLIGADGSASALGRALRVFDTQGSAAISSRINARAISETRIVLWAAARGQASSLSAVQVPRPAESSQDVVDQALFVLPLRTGLRDAPATQMLRITGQARTK